MLLVRPNDDMTFTKGENGVKYVKENTFYHSLDHDIVFKNCDE